MQFSLPTPYELWDLQKPTVPVRSRLFHLEPIGKGTLHVESLTSYIAQLAEYHCVSTEKLILAEIVPLLSKKGHMSSSRNIKWLFGEFLKILER